MVRNTPQAWGARAGEETAWGAAMWSREGQRRRFEMAAELLARSARDAESVFDFGCGTAAFCTYLYGRLETRGLRYFGWDWAPEIRARARADNAGAAILESFPAGDVYDHVVCIGPFNLSDNWSKYETREKLAELWRMARSSMVVSLYRGVQRPGMLSYGFDDVVRIIERLGYPRTTLTTEHADNDVMLRFVRSSRA